MDRPSWIDDAITEGRGRQNGTRWYSLPTRGEYLALDVAEARTNGLLTGDSVFREWGYPDQWPEEAWRFVELHEDLPFAFGRQA